MYSVKLSRKKKEQKNPFDPEVDSRTITSGSNAFHVLLLCYLSLVFVSFSLSHTLFFLRHVSGVQCGV